MSVCPTCNGMGRVRCRVCENGTIRCPTCMGTVRVQRGNNVVVSTVIGEDAHNVKEVLTSIINKGAGGQIVEINISKSTIGLLNVGEMKNIQSISTNVSSLGKAGYTEIANALKELTEAVVNSKEVTENQRSEFLDMLNDLSVQATKPLEERLKTGTLKTIAASLASTAAVAGGLASVWATWGPAITKFLAF